MQQNHHSGLRNVLTATREQAVVKKSNGYLTRSFQRMDLESPDGITLGLMAEKKLAADVCRGGLRATVVGLC